MIINHQDDLDFGVGIIVYRSQDIRAAECKWISKRSVSFIPFFGWVHYLVGMLIGAFWSASITSTGDLYLHRSYETDAENIRQWLSKFKERGFKRIVIFPEGTRSRNKQKLLDSQKYLVTYRQN